MEMSVNLARTLPIIIFLLCHSIAFHSIATAQALGSQSSHTVTILVIGRTGSGKSTLINNILGRDIAPVGHKLSPKTRTVSVYEEEISGASVTACDTPGLRDALDKEEDYMDKIKVSCGDPDLVLFCQSMDNARWQSDDTEAVKIVTDHLGKDIWKNSVLVLTRADKLVDSDMPRNYSKKQINDFKQKISEFVNMFHDALSKAGISRAITVPSAVSAKGLRDLPGVQYWLTELMVTCLSRSSERGRDGLTKMIKDRLKSPETMSDDEFNKPEHEQPFVVTSSLCELIKL